MKKRRFKIFISATLCLTILIGLSIYLIDLQFIKLSLDYEHNGTLSDVHQEIRDLNIPESDLLITKDSNGYQVLFKKNDILFDNLRIWHSKQSQDSTNLSDNSEIEYLIGPIQTTSKEIFKQTLDEYLLNCKKTISDKDIRTIIFTNFLNDGVLSILNQKLSTGITCVKRDNSFTTSYIISYRVSHTCVNGNSMAGSYGRRIIEIEANTGAVNSYIEHEGCGD